MEGWPDTAHGGIITSIFHEAIERNANMYTKEDSDSVAVVDIEVSFHIIVRAGSIYSIHIHPGFFDDEGRQIGPLEGEDAANEELASSGLQKVSTSIFRAHLLETDRPTVGTSPFEAEPHREVLYASTKCVLNTPIHVNMVP